MSTRELLRSTTIARLARRWLRADEVESFEGSIARRYSLLPIIIIALWWLTSYGMYATGWPIPYTRQNILMVSLLVLATLMVTLLGFLTPLRESRFSVQARSSNRIPRLVLIGLGLSALLLIPISENYSGYHLWQIGEALMNQGAAFTKGSEKIAEGTSSRLLIVVAQTVAAPLTLAVIPYFALQWFERRKHFALLAIAVAVPVSLSILTGRDFQTVVTAVVVFCTWLVSRMRRRIFFSWKDAAVLGSGAALYLVVFAIRKLSRSGTPTVAICPPGVEACAPSGPPTLWDSAVVYFSSYASQSFEGLGRALNGTWRFGGGLAHSGALSSLAESIFGKSRTHVITDQLSHYGWSATGNWSTGLVWLANDVPWVIVPLVVAFQGVLLAFVWRSAIRTGDWLSTTLFCYSWLSLFFMMQNLQIAISGPIYLGYWTLVLIYLGRSVRRRVARGPVPEMATTPETTR